MSNKKSAFQNKKPSMRTYIILLVVVFVIAAVVSIFAGGGAPADENNTEKMVFQVSAGENATKITARLKEAGLIDNELSFKMYLKSNKFEDKLRVGTYVLSPSMTTEEIVDELLNGVGEMMSFTIPEGYTLRDIADLFVTEEIMSADTFWQLVRTYDVSAYPFMEGCPDNDHRLEGFLFPDTYFIAKHTAPEKIFSMMLDRFAEVWNALPENKSGLSNYDTVILASMVESEAKFDSERATIASVYMNRKAKGMYMQCDATILYGMPERKTQLLYSDYEYDSIYNTYKHAGFPPTPIGNPGKESLIAACQPEKTEYLYYLWDRVDNDGHIFSKTYNEHLNHSKRLGY
ncbi:MAG: endolytic transglycosylase MltG [Peptococcaceae bacterium]|nr:endolytic transglycosylase MltG [Peptococcaceae bacterium]